MNIGTPPEAMTTAERTAAIALVLDDATLPLGEFVAIAMAAARLLRGATQEPSTVSSFVPVTSSDTVEHCVRMIRSFISVPTELPRDDRAQLVRTLDELARRPAGAAIVAA